MKSQTLPTAGPHAEATAPIGTEAVVAKSLKFKIAQLRHLIEQAEKSKLEARSLHVSDRILQGPHLRAAGCDRDLGAL